MKDMQHQYALLRTENLDGFISRLSSIRKVMAPVSKGYNNYSFEKVDSGEKIALNYIPTILPPKKYFMPQRETLLAYQIGKGINVETVVEYEEMALFGVHTLRAFSASIWYFRNAQKITTILQGNLIF